MCVCGGGGGGVLYLTVLITLCTGQINRLASSFRSMGIALIERVQVERG